MNIYQKLVEVRKSVESFKKDATGYNFKYVPGVQVLTEIKGKMDSEGIILEPHLIETVVTHLDKTWFVSSKMKMVWVNSEKPEDRIGIDWFCTGEQKDPSQALGSALTYAERYFLLKFFGIPTDEDDPDSKNQTLNDRKSPAKSSVKSPVRSSTKTSLKPETEAQLKKRLVAEHNGDIEAAKKEFEEIMKKREEAA
jgi:hypothetical protein